jgi:two-component system, OmpR family, sensor kinase
MTLRRRVLLALAALAVLVFALGSLSTVLIRDFLLKRLDQSLELPIGKNQIPPVVLVTNARCSVPQVAQGVVVVADRDGRTLPCPGRLDIPIDFPKLGLTPDSTSSLFTVSSDGQTFRARAFRMRTGEFVAFAVPLADTQRTIRRVARVQLAVALSSLLGVALVARWLLRRGVAPLDSIADTADLITSGDRTKRVALGGHAKDEVGRVGLALNGMLDELDRSFTDVTASRDERQRSEERLRQFVQDASHELRTPLTSIRGYTELYQSGALPTDEAKADAIGRIASEGGRMSRLVNDMLLLAKVDAEPQLTLASVDLVDIARNAATDANVADSKWSVSVEAVGPVAAVVDSHAIQQVISNLLGNVRAHTPPGTSTTVNVSKIRDGCEIVVSDNGPGIDPEVLPEVFERFVRADRARSSESGGVGLGLAIVRSIVRAHSGSIEASNVAAGGASFRIWLPAESVRNLGLGNSQ